jgi:hypothetical protein
MRFRKSISLGKGVKLNISKSGVSTSIGGKGASLNTGSKGTYLNTGIPGTGLYDRKKISGNTATGRNITVTEGNMTTMGTGNGYTMININDIDEFSGIPSCPKNNPVVHIVLLFLTWGIGNLFYYLHVKNKQNQWKVIENRRKILEPKLKGIKNNELFGNAKVFIIDLNNIVAFSDKGYIALWTENNDEMKVFSVGDIQKMNQEIKPGPCYAHFYTNDFDNNSISLYLGEVHSKEETESKRSLYNEIKGLLSVLKGQFTEKKSAGSTKNKDKSEKTVDNINAASTEPTVELKKYKELLDTGVITQEDFDAKKKQLLNL